MGTSLRTMCRTTRPASKQAARCRQSARVRRRVLERGWRSSPGACPAPSCSASALLPAGPVGAAPTHRWRRVQAPGPCSCRNCLRRRGGPPRPPLRRAPGVLAEPGAARQRAPVRHRAAPRHPQRAAARRRLAWGAGVQARGARAVRAVAPAAGRARVCSRVRRRVGACAGPAGCGANGLGGCQCQRCGWRRGCWLACLIIGSAQAQVQQLTSDRGELRLGRSGFSGRFKAGAPKAH